MRSLFAPESWVILVPHLINACIAIYDPKWWSSAPKIPGNNPDKRCIGRDRTQNKKDRS